MTPSELVAIGMALEEMERPRARERMEWASSDPHDPRITGVGATREIVGTALGISVQTRGQGASWASRLLKSC
jgi:hypothetical protein